MKILEVCVDSVESAIAAAQGGADRLELCGNLVIGGTTPTPALFRAVRAATELPVHVMIRPRCGDFLYAEEELRIMEEDLRMFRSLGAQGAVFGALTADGNLDLAAMERLCRAADGMSVTLHRAFDVCRDPFRSLEDAVSLGIRTILTSGQKETCTEGIALLKELHSAAADRIEIMAGAGLTDKGIPALHAQAGITAFHMSGKKRVPSAMVYRNPDVHMGLPGLPEYELEICDEDKIRAAADALRLL